MGAVGFVWRAPRRRPGLAATLFVFVAAAGLTAAAVLPRLHHERVMISMGSVLGAVLVALLGAAAVDWRGGRVIETWQLRSHLKLAVLGELDAKLMQSIRAELSPHHLDGPPVRSDAPRNATGWPLAPLTSASAEPPTGMASTEQVVGFHELRTRLLAVAAGLQVGRPFAILVVPVRTGSGGSFVARNLAASFSGEVEDGESALLIDCNLVRPTQHIALRTGDDGGLFAFLDEPHVNFAPKPTGIHGLYLIPAGRPKSPSRDYFASNQMRALMQVIRASGRFVVLDGPPAKESRAASDLSNLADLVVLVAGYGKCTAEDISQTAAMFDPAKFAGVVFNEGA
jgi:protein-tyrosine kinase